MLIAILVSNVAARVRTIEPQLAPGEESRAQSAFDYARSIIRPS